MEYEAICIAGGGCKGVALLGLLYEWDVRKRLSGISHWSVCSVGGFIAVLLLCGVNPLKMLSYFPKVPNIAPSMDLLSTLLNHAGILHIQNYTKKFCHTVEQFVGVDNPTLAQFHAKTGKTLYIAAVNATEHDIVYFNHIDHPNVSLFSAIWASAAIPGVFIPVKIGSSRFIDGGIYNSVPLEPLMGKKTIAFNYQKPDEVDPLDGLLNILKLNTIIAKKEAIRRHKQLTMIDVKCTFSLLDFGKTPSELLDEFSLGRGQFTE